MFHEPPEIAYDPGYAPREIRGGDLLLAFSGDNVLLARGAIPTAAMCPPPQSRPRYLFSVAGAGVFLAQDALEGTELLHYLPVRTFRSMGDPVQAFAGITGCHLWKWYEANRFCGRCGAALVDKADERALCCPHCGHVVYPSIAPAVIAAITDGERLLLTRAAQGAYRRDALVAGYVEIGETLEAALLREVREETGLQVADLRYIASQPWGFSGSLLAGFFCRLQGSPAIRLLDGELGQARWVSRGELPAQPHPMSLTRTMMELFRTGQDPYSR